METLNKIYLPKINRPVDWKTLLIWAKGLILNVLSLGKKVFWVGAATVILLIFQVLIIGVSDRLGISPKVSLLVSSLVYAAFLTGLVIIGGLKSKAVREVVILHLGSRSVCKILIIKKKKQEVQ